jgi:hypothetical protein
VKDFREIEASATADARAAASELEEFYRRVDAARPSAADREAALVRQTHLMEVGRPGELLRAMGWDRA